MFSIYSFLVTSSKDFSVSNVEKDFDANMKAHSLRLSPFVLFSASSGSLPVMKMTFWLEL